MGASLLALAESMLHFFSEQPFNGNYSTLNSHTNTVVSHAFADSSKTVTAVTGLFCLGRIFFLGLIFSRAITALDCDRRWLLLIWVYIYLELWKRVSKHFVLSLNFPCLIAGLLYYLLMSVFCCCCCCCCCFVVGDLYRGGYTRF